MLSVNLIPFTPELRPKLPPIEACKDYRLWREDLVQLDSLLASSGIQEQFVALSLAQLRSKTSEELTLTQELRHQDQSRVALRCQLLCILDNLDCRAAAVRLADSRVFQWFCGLEQIDCIKTPSKSALDRYSRWLPTDSMNQLTDSLLQQLQRGDPKLRLGEVLDLSTVYLDTTCLETHIHFPVDWVLLRDAVRTLMGSIQVIRSHGLKRRMPSPQSFLKEINQLSMAMSANRRQEDSRKARKRVLREMKKVVKIVEEHARRYRQLLDANWEQGDLTRKQAAQVLKRIDAVLELLPRARKQAHERIIGERQVPSAGKLLSLYEPETRVVVRGKAGAEVEFGNKLFVGESKSGLLLDWKLYKDSPPADVTLLKASLERLEKKLPGVVKAAVSDRGFDSSGNRELLESSGRYNGLCPKSPLDLEKRMKEKRFSVEQKRRAQTEGRIGILKNVYCGGRLKVKGFEHRENALVWAVFTHNLKKVVRMQLESKEQEKQKAA